MRAYTFVAVKFHTVNTKYNTDLYKTIFLSYIYNYKKNILSLYTLMIV